MRRWISRKSAWDAELISSFVVGGWTRLGPRKYELRAKAVYIVSPPKPYLYPTLPHANKLLLWGSLHGQEAKLLPGHLKIYKYSTLRDLLESLCQVLIFWYLSIFLKYLYALNIKVSLFSKSVHVSTSLILIVLIRLLRERRRSFHLSLSILFLPKEMTKTFLLYRCEMHKYGNPSSLPRLLIFP